MKIADINRQRSEWKRKGWSIPELRGGKQEWFNIVVELVKIIGTNSVVDLSATPKLDMIDTLYPWRTYAPFLKGVGLVSNRSGVLSLSDEGIGFLQLPSKDRLAGMLHDKYRLVGEILDFLALSPKTVEEIDKELCQQYCLDWGNLSNTRRRMDWLEILGLIESVGNRKWGLTESGKIALERWELVTPEVVDAAICNNEEIVIASPPTEIEELLINLKADPTLHKSRNTYNVWVPSPNRIENLRAIVQFSSERVSRSDLFKFIEDEFGLKTSSVESMMPFLRADGLLEEVGRNIYVATSAAKAWCNSGNDLDFIRIIHSHKRFVGEMIVFATEVVTRNDIYEEAEKYGLNREKARWIMGFLLEAGVLEETQYLHVKATPVGLKFALDLPLMEPYIEKQETNNTNEQKVSNAAIITSNPDNHLFDRLRGAARDPMAESKASGVAFEVLIAEMFSHMGFDAKRIGGAGNTDVIVRWKDSDGKIVTAIVDGKSKSSGTVTHTDISDIAIETHKEKNNAEYVAIIGPAFSGNTIKNFARKKGFSLITDEELIDIAQNAQSLGLSLDEIAMLFKVPSGLAQLNELIDAKKREKEILTLVISTFKQEQDAMESLSARDLYFLLRRTELSPSLEELISAFDMLSKEEIGVLTQVKKASAAENTTYEIHSGKYCVNRLHALANAIEKGLY